MMEKVLSMFSIFIVAIRLEKAVCACCCLQTSNGNGLPIFTNYGSQPRIYRHHQAIIPSYNFNCCGNITEWAVGVQPAGSVSNLTYDIDFQVWRLVPSPTVDDSTVTGQYSLIGKNRFISISLESYVARLTPSPQDFIQFQPRDVLGFYVEEARLTTNGVVVLTSPSSFTSEVVWFASIDPVMATSQSVYSVGSNGDLNSLTRAAPVISIAISKSLVWLAILSIMTVEHL